MSTLYIVSVFVVLGAAIVGFSPLYSFGGRRVPSTVGILVLMILISILLISRDIAAPTDFQAYVGMYNQAKSFEAAISAYHGNIFFSSLLYLGNTVGFDAKFFYAILPLLYILILFYGLRLVGFSYKSLLLAISFFLASSTFVFYHVNIIRQGLAFSICILALGFYIKRKHITSFLIFVLAFLSHFSSIFFILPVLFSGILPIKLIIQSRYFPLLLMFSPLVIPMLGSISLETISSMGGAFSRIDSFAEMNYTNYLIVYARIAILFFFMLFFFYYGKKLSMFNDKAYTLIFFVYTSFIFVILFTLPVLLISSRFIYYPSGLLPPVLSCIFYARRNLLSFRPRFYLFFICLLLHGFLVYSFPSVRENLGS
jgi:hypothetical protein